MAKLKVSTPGSPVSAPTATIATSNTTTTSTTAAITTTLDISRGLEATKRQPQFYQHTIEQNQKPRNSHRRCYHHPSDQHQTKHHRHSTGPPIGRFSSSDDSLSVTPVMDTPSSISTPSMMAPGTKGKQPSMSDLALKISTATAKVEEWFAENGLTPPSFDVDSPDDFPKMPDEIAQCRRDVVGATEQLRNLMYGPRERVRWMAWDFMPTQCLGIIYHYGLAKLVPEDGTPISLDDLATKTSLDPINLARILRLAISHNVFREPYPRHIAHTSSSKLLATDEALQAWVGFNTADIYKASAHTLDALIAYPEADDMLRTGFNVAFDTVDTEPMFVTFGRDPLRARRMGQAMTSLTGSVGYELSYTVEATDFSAEDRRGGLFVDVGGSHGFVCAALAQQYRGLRFVCQDLPKTVESAPRPAVPGDDQASERVAFAAHDFYEDQTAPETMGADVWFFRWILHNQPKPYAVRMLKALIPAMKPGARVIINDYCLEEPGKADVWDDRLVRGMDLVMLTLLNAQERDEREFKDLFQLADSRFVFKGVTRLPGYRMSVIEAVWMPDDVKKDTISE